MASFEDWLLDPNGQSPIAYGRRQLGAGRLRFQYAGHLPDQRASRRARRARLLARTLVHGGRRPAGEVAWSRAAPGFRLYFRYARLRYAKPMSTIRPDEPFELDPQLYDQLVNWPRRLAREGPFFRRLFEAHRVQSVLDVACGTGHHAALFASWGLTVLGVDGSAAMVDYCRRTHGTTAHLHWQHARMEHLDLHPHACEAAVCLGNSLALLPERAAVRDTLRALAATLSATGLFVIQVLNLAALPDGPIVWQKARHVAAPGGPRCFVKGVHRSGRRGFVDVAEVPLDRTDDVSHCRSTPLLWLDAAELHEALAAAGRPHVQMYGGYDGTAFDAENSGDLIVVARRE